MNISCFGMILAVHIGVDFDDFGLVGYHFLVDCCSLCALFLLLNFHFDKAVLVVPAVLLAISLDSH